MASWVFCIGGLVLILLLVGIERDTQPFAGWKIALMLLPCALVMIVMPIRGVGLQPHPVSVGTFAATWAIVSGLHPGRVWQQRGSPGRGRALGGLWLAIAAASAVWIIFDG